MFKAIPIAIAAISFSSALWAVPNPVAVYSFDNTFASSVGGAPALTATDPLGQSGFGTDVVFGQNASVYNFAGSASPVTDQAGLSLDVSSLLAGHSANYSIEIVFKFTQGQNAWRRIVDVQDRQSDNGFYVDPANNLDIYPVAGGDAFTNNVYHDVFLVNDNGSATFYLDGSAPTVVTTHIMDIDSNNKVNFFLDNVVGGGQGEYSNGSVALIRIYDTALNSPPPIPEPASYAMLLAGLGALSAIVRRRSAR